MIKIRKNKPFVIFLVVFGLLIFLHSVGIIRPLEDSLSALITPISEQLYRRGNNFNDSYHQRKNSQNLTSQVTSLTQEVERLTVANSKYQAVAEENKKLRSQLDFLSKNKFKAVISQVIAKEALANVDSQEWDIIIDKGKNSGLRTGLAVVSEGGTIIGKIVDIKDTSAKVCLVTSRACRLAATVQNQSKTIGLTEGELGLTVKMNYIPQSDKISLNDIVITSGLGRNIPRGLVIGKITAINNASNDVWQSATIEPLINFNNLTLVSVILP